MILKLDAFATETSPILPIAGVTCKAKSVSLAFQRREQDGDNSMPENIENSIVDGPLSFDKAVEQELALVNHRRSALRTHNNAQSPAKSDGSDLTALCLSGGGVRSATFCLGIARAFARKGCLKEFDYLSTVSGGGFTGSFITRLVADQMQQTSKKENEILDYATAELLLADEHGFNRSGIGNLHRPLSYLKENISYLTPRVGLFSLDSLAGAGLLLRNLFLNWLVIIPYYMVLICLVLAAFELVCIATFAGTNAPFTLRVGLPVMGITFLGWTMAESLNHRPNLAARKERPSEAAEPIYSFPKVFLTSGIPAFIAALLFATSALVTPDNWQVLDLIYVVSTGAVVMLAAFAQALALTPSDDKNISSWWKLGLFASLLMQGALFAVFVYFVGAWVLSELPKGDLVFRSQIVLLFGPILFTVSLFLSEAIYVALTSNSPNGELEREWLARSTGALFRLPLVWLLLGGAIVFGPDLIEAAKQWLQNLVGQAPGGPATATATATLTGIAGFLLLLAGKVQDGLTFASANLEKLKKYSLQTIFTFALPLFVFGITALLSTFTSEIAHRIRLEISSAPEHYLNCLFVGVTMLLIFFALAVVHPRSNAKSANQFAWDLLPPLTLAILFFAFHLFQTTLFAFAKGSGYKAFSFLILALFVGMLAMIADWFVDCNKFSLHRIYRNRIIRTFLGAAISNRTKLGFADFAESDNLELAKIGDLIEEEPHEKIPPQVHLFNFAMNVPASENLGLQERKALPFTASPLHVGSIGIYHGDKKQTFGSYRSSRNYSKDSALISDKAMTVGTAAAISGAAFNSNMGYQSTAAYNLILTAFNVRLGVWLGNPGDEGRHSYKTDGPTFAIKSLVLEALGLANENRAYVHLSDGGHFENLAVYEMLARRCKLIVVIDAGADPTREFADLSIMQRMAFLDLATDISFPEMEFNALQQGSRSFMIGDITYCNEPRSNGKLVYIKPAACADAPVSVVAYGTKSPLFPQEPTIDQWFNESQFSAYLQLGEHIGAKLLAEMPASKHVNEWADSM